MIDDHSMSTPLCLAAFARIIQNERVDKRHIAQKKIGIAFAGEPNAFAGKPLKRSMLPHMNDGIRAPASFGLRSSKPAIKSNVMMCRRKIWRVINRIRIETEAAWWLQRDKDIAKLHRGKQIIVLVSPRFLLVNRNHLAADSWQQLLVCLFRGKNAWPVSLRLAPEILHPSRRTLRKISKHCAIGCTREALSLRRIERVKPIIGSAPKKILHQLIRRLGQRRDIVPSRSHRPQRRQKTGRSVKADRATHLR